MKLILDTHVFIWWACEPEKIPAETLKAIQDSSNEVFFSSAVSWEVQIKLAIGKITFHEPWEIIVRREVGKNSFQVLPVTLEHTFSLHRLPPIHEDPFDRILVAQALTEKCTLVTNDNLISDYPDVAILWS